MTRNFDCPLTGEPCGEGGCTRTSCVKAASERMAAEAFEREAETEWYRDDRGKLRRRLTLKALLKL